MILYIDTTDFNRLTFALFDGRKLFKNFYKLDAHKSREILGILQKFLKQSKIVKPGPQIKKILVNKGPGSFTGTRIGVAHALALGFAWNVPVKFLTSDLFKSELTDRER